MGALSLDAAIVALKYPNKEPTRMRVARLFMLAVIGGMVVPFVSAPAHAQSARGITVQVNDALQIEVWRNAELSGTYTVRADGAIGHPLYSQIKAAGLSTAELETRVRDFLTRFGANPQFVITHMIPVSIGGEVRQPDLYMVPAGSSLATVFGQAGGPTQQASLQKVQLLRGNTRLALDLTSASANSMNTVLASGDQILVPRSVSVLREYIAPTASVLAAIGVIVNIIVK
jgi:protein involved in polysaccharide export with SLBB domain